MNKAKYMLSGVIATLVIAASPVMADMNKGGMPNNVPVYVNTNVNGSHEGVMANDFGPWQHGVVPLQLGSNEPLPVNLIESVQRFDVDLNRIDMRRGHNVSFTLEGKKVRCMMGDKATQAGVPSENGRMASLWITLNFSYPDYNFTGGTCKFAS